MWRRSVPACSGSVARRVAAPDCTGRQRNAAAGRPNARCEFRTSFALPLRLSLQFFFCAALESFRRLDARQEMPVRFVACGIAAGIAFLFAVPDFPVNISLRQQAILFWGVAVALRFIVLPLEPGDDFWRYQWEGQNSARRLQSVRPSAGRSRARVRCARSSRTGTRSIIGDFRAIYPPGAQLVFAALSWIGDHPLLYKYCSLPRTSRRLAVLLLLLSAGPSVMRTRRGMHGTRSSFTASPAPRISTACMVLPMMAGVFLLTQFEAAMIRRAKWMLALAAAALFGVAISIKLIPLLLLPLCVFALRTRALDARAQRRHSRRAQPALRLSAHRYLGFVRQLRLRHAR